VTPFGIFGVAVLAVLVTVIMALTFSPRHKRRPGLNDRDEFVPYPTDYPVALDKMRDRFRDGGLAHSIPRAEPPAAANAYHTAKGPVPPSFGKRKPSIFLTPRQLERVNIQRKLQGRQPLNRRGFTNAVAHAWDQHESTHPTRQSQPVNTGDWLTYLILYECLFDDHSTGRTYVDTGLTITPEAPYNGHGGEFAGAGASGDWASPTASTAAAAAAIAADGGAPFPGPQYDDAGGPAMAPSDPAYSRPVEPAITGNGYHFTDPAPSTPSYTPDPSPSYTPDPSPSYSPDPSPSFDSGSSSSGGGDGS
jgi:hypothetical protein